MIIEVSYEASCFGHAVFCHYVRDVLNAADLRGGEPRESAEALPGAALACLETGIREKADVAAVVSRVVECAPETVARFVDEFTGSDPHRHLFKVEVGELTSHPGPLQERYPDFDTAA